MRNKNLSPKQKNFQLKYFGVEYATEQQDQNLKS